MATTSRRLRKCRPVQPEFFVVGAPRSGTTLLRTVLNGHPDVCVPAETNFLPRLLQLRPMWWRRGRLDEALFARLACANGRLALHGIHREDVEGALRRQSVDSPPEAIHRMYELLGGGAVRIGDKSPSYALAIPRFDQFFGSQTRYLHIVRHPLAVTASLMGQPWAPRSADLAASIWHRYVTAVDLLRDDPRCLTLRLEDLVAHPADEVARVAEHLQLEPHPAMLDFTDRAHESQEGNFYPESHAGLSGPLRATRPWRSQLSAADQGRAWGIAGALAERYGYVEQSVRARRAPGLRTRMAAFRVGQQWRRARTVANLVSPRG